MAVTKLLHQKECKGNPSRHLYNAIKYILNPKKTEGGLLVGGNCGVSYQEVYQAMMQTKREHQKMRGRQGYHFVISFKKGEATKEIAYEIGQEFCDAYLQDSYDYVYAVHTDTEHLHIHLVFNSVSYDGYKYHYSPGDWKKSVQPVTDKLCRKYHLSEMLFEDEKKGVTYAEWNAKKHGKVTQRSLVRQDINTALAQVSTYKAFLTAMSQMGYSIRAGNSRKHGVYLAFTPPGTKQAYRSYNLGEDYSPEKLQERVSLQVNYKNYAPMVKKVRIYGQLQGQKYLSAFQKRIVAKYYRSGLSYKNRRGSCFDDRKNILAIDRLYEQCRYLIRNHISNEQELQIRIRDAELQEENLKKEYYSVRLSAEDAMLRERYLQMKRESDKRPGEDVLIDRLEEFWEKYPIAEWERRLQFAEVLNERIEQIRKEKRLLRQIEKEVSGHPRIQEDKYAKRQREKLYQQNFERKV